MDQSDKIFLAVLIALVIVIVWVVLMNGGGGKENLHSYWYRTNCTPSQMLKVIGGEWKAVGSGATYKFISPKMALSASESTLIGADEATGAELVDKVIAYAASKGLYQAGERNMKTDPMLQQMFGTASSMVSMRQVGALGSKVMMSISQPGGGSYDIEYEFEFCFYNPRTGQLYLRLYRPSNERTYNLLVSTDELKLRNEGFGEDVLIATR